MSPADAALAAGVSCSLSPPPHAHTLCQMAALGVSKEWGTCPGHSSCLWARPPVTCLLAETWLGPALPAWGGGGGEVGRPLCSGTDDRQTDRRSGHGVRGRDFCPLELEDFLPGSPSKHVEDLLCALLQPGGPGVGGACVQGRRQLMDAANQRVCMPRPHGGQLRGRRARGREGAAPQGPCGFWPGSLPWRLQAGPPLCQLQHPQTRLGAGRGQTGHPWGEEGGGQRGGLSSRPVG